VTPGADGRAGSLRLDLEWRTTALTLVLLPGLVWLGLWQLQRAEEKVAIGSQWEQRRLLPPQPLGELDSQDVEGLKYLPVALEGQFAADHYFLLDNRIYQGKFGYEVLGIVQLAGSGQMVLVNRGWIAGDSSRRSLPWVPEVVGPVALTGHVYVAPGAPYMLADLALEPGWPKRIQAIEMAKLASAVEAVTIAPLFPYTVRIDPDHRAALTVDWQVVNVSPAKHKGYAVQWFAMAVALGILFILRSSNLWQVLTGDTRKQS